jgi:recombination protein RecA
MVNQWREKIGLTWGDPRVTPGGRAKNYWYFTRVELKRDEWLTEGEKRNQRKVGLSIKCLIKKNKGFPPERVAAFDFYFDHNEVGVSPGSYDPAKEILNLAIYYDVITTKGAYYYHGDESWHGRTALEEQVRWDLTLRQTLQDAVMDVVTKGRRPEVSPPASGRRLRRA